MSISFDWNKEKNLTNQKKHRILFEEAQTVFADENALLIDDIKRNICKGDDNEKRI